MTEPDEMLARRFEEHRTQLRAVAYRLLGSVHEADDAVQEAWLRLARLAPDERAAIENLGAWLTTTTSRLCLDQLRARGRREADLPEHEEEVAPEPGPEADAVLVDQVGAALQVVLATLSPAERLAFVLHDLFAVPFEEVAVVMGRSTTAVRQLASRGRRRVRGEADPDDDVDRAPGQRAVVEAFLAAARAGEFEALLDLLDPGAAVRADTAAAAMGVPSVRLGATEVARTFSGGAAAARLALIDGLAGLTWSHAGQLKVAFVFHLDDAGRIVEIEQLADPGTLAGLHLEWPRRGSR